MKTTAFILAIYLLFVGAVPCSEPEGCDDEHDSITLCSPFFSCDCGCVVPMVTGTVLEPVMKSSAVREYNEFVALSLPNLHIEFWQPPKLG